MFEAAHQSLDCGTPSSLSRILLQPFSKRNVQGLVLRTGDQTGLFDKVFIGTEGNIPHSAF